MAATVEDGSAIPAPARTNIALTPPTSDEGHKPEGSVASELSEIEPDEDDIGEVEPDHYYEGGRIPVFTPTMDQFRSFPKFVQKINRYGMKSGVVKVVPPKEWHDSLPALDRAVKTIKVKNPITQEFSGAHGTYTQANIEKQRSYNLPQWKALTEETQHQPPARRGERRKQQERPTRVAAQKPKSEVTQSADRPPAKRRRPGRPRKTNESLEVPPPADDVGDSAVDDSPKIPPTPTSPNPAPKTSERSNAARSSVAPRSKGRQPRSVTERRKYNRQETAETIDEVAFENFDYRFYGNDEFTAERCQELETLYWKSLTFAPPMYGADMPGSLFDDSTTSWNVAKLENLLDVLGQKVPGVNTAYLYLGMWKATFAWHLEDVDLYSINYIHFGAPKQWYSISQEDARRFERAMKDVWPNDAKNCGQFLRHKTYLISPTLLKQQYGITVNKMVHYEGEFVITFPYGYHSGYNLGYNCAESVNFATEEWLDYGRIAKKCDCEADSVWVDVGEIERKLRGESTPEYYEETDDEELDEGPTDLPSPPASVVGKPRSSLKRKRPTQSQNKVKKIKIRLKTSTVEPCVLCPNDMPFYNLLPTDTGRHAHELCALYTPETTVSVNEFGSQGVGRVSAIDKARLELKCSYCRLKKGACFQCSERKCTRAFHATCAAAAGVRVEQGMTAWFDSDGTEYEREIFDFRCRFHRPKRSKTMTSDALESDSLVHRHVRSLGAKDVVQIQFLQGDVFAGTIVEMRPEERTIVVDVLPDGDRIEAEWKYVLVNDIEDSKIPKPSANAKPLPAHLEQQSLEGGNSEFGPPVPDDPFGKHGGPQTWAEFKVGEIARNPEQVKVDFTKPDQIWFYLGRFSTDARSQFTEDPSNPRDNTSGNFLNHIRSKQNAALLARSRQFAPGAPLGAAMLQQPNGVRQPATPSSQPWARTAPSRPLSYQYKPKVGPSPGPSLTKQPNGVTGQRPNMPNLAPSTKPSPLNSIGNSYQPRPLANIQPSSTLISNQGTRPLNLTNPYVFPQQQNVQPANKHPPPVQSQSGLQQAAPVARMMAPATTNVNSDNPGETLQTPAVASNSPEQDYLTRISKYPYLRNSFLRRPKSYKSPYSPDGNILMSNLKSASPKQKSHSPTSRRPSMHGGASQRSQASPLTTNGGVPSAGMQQQSPIKPIVPPPHQPQPQYQTPSQFQQQLKGEGDAHGSQGSKHERIFAQMARTATDAVDAASSSLASSATKPPSGQGRR